MAKGQASRRSLRASRRLQSPELLEVRAAPGAGTAGLMVGAAWFGFGDRPSEGIASGPDGQAPLAGLLGATCLSDRTFRVPRTIVQPEAPRSEPLSSLAAVQRSPETRATETAADPAPASSNASWPADFFSGMFSHWPRRFDPWRFAVASSLPPGPATTGDTSPAPAA